MKFRKIFLSVLCIVSFSRIYADNDHSKMAAARDKIQPLEKTEWKIVTQDFDDTAYTFIPADDERFDYNGRIDTTDPAAPVLIWEGTQVRCNFTGTRFGVRFEKTSRNANFNIIIDGKIYLLQMKQNTYPVDYILGKKLPDTAHNCIIFKRNEAYFDTDTFLGIDVAAEGTSKEATGKLGAKPDPYPLKIEFYGDSITAGACNEVPGNDNYDDMVQHNNYTTYSAITCRNLNAEYSDIAISGTGICVSWNPLILSEMWKNLYAEVRGKQYDFSGRVPDIVVVNLGQNDFGYTSDKGDPFPPDFQEKYEGFLKELRAQYPTAWIISATGGMGAVKSSRKLNSGIIKAIKAMNDPKILRMTFNDFTYDHPRVDTHIKMAKQLETFIRTNVIIPGIE